MNRIYRFKFVLATFVAFHTLFLLLSWDLQSVLAQYSTHPPSTAAPTYCDVLIIGGGISGLSSSIALSRFSRGQLNSCIVEGRGRLGGRIYSVKSDEMELTYDVGAAWIHGVNGNPISVLARENNITTVPTDWLMVNTSVDGRWMQPIDVAIGYAISEELFDDGMAAATNASGGIDFSLDSLYTNLSHSSPPLSASVASMLNVLIGGWEVDNAASLREISGLYDAFVEQFDYSGDQVIFPQGYSQIIDLLANQIDSNTIFLNSTVTDIYYDSVTPGNVSITTPDGRVFVAPSAIVTLPLGVLQAGSVSFHPQLPQRKLDVIDRMGMGQFHKTILRFNQPIYDDRHSCWLFRVNSTEIPHVEESTQDSNLPPRFFQYWLNMYTYFNEPVIIGFNVGDSARSLANWSDDQIVETALFELSNMLGVSRSEIPEPAEVILSAWQTDPYSNGAYSFAKEGALPTDANVLAEPVGSLFFAGEATSYEHPGYVHGAYEEGIRAAKQILQL